MMHYPKVLDPYFQRAIGYQVKTDSGDVLGNVFVLSPDYIAEVRTGEVTCERKRDYGDSVHSVRRARRTG